MLVKSNSQEIYVVTAVLHDFDQKETNFCIADDGSSYSQYFTSSKELTIIDHRAPDDWIVSKPNYQHQYTYVSFPEFANDMGQGSRPGYYARYVDQDPKYYIGDEREIMETHLQAYYHMHRYDILDHTGKHEACIYSNDDFKHITKYRYVHNLRLKLFNYSDTMRANLYDDVTRYLSSDEFDELDEFTQASLYKLASDLHEEKVHFNAPWYAKILAD